VTARSLFVRPLPAAGGSTSQSHANIDSQILSAWAFVAVICNAACSGGHGSPEQASPFAPEPPAMPAATVDASSAMSPCDQPSSGRDVPFVNVFFPLSDACPSRRQAPGTSTTSVRLMRDDAGRVCMKGRVTDGWAELVVGLDGNNTTGGMAAPPMLQPLDAPAHGISRFRFTLDTPPEPGLLVEAGFVVGEGCFPDCELHKGYFILEDAAPDPAPRSFNESGSYSVRLADFRAVPPFDTRRSLDTTHLAGLFFDVGIGDFDFCVDAVAFE
jgi:hypothetical protein